MAFFICGHLRNLRMRMAEGIARFRRHAHTRRTLSTDMSSAIATELRVNPFLHIDAGRIYNPLTDRALDKGDAEYELLRRAIDGGFADEALEEGGWLVRGDVSRLHRLKIVSLETTIACNQKCYFCPVSIAPREDYDMPVALFERIVNQLTAYRPTLESVFLQSYNEPTMDRRFVDFCKTLFAAKLPVAVLSNGSGLTPAKVDALIEGGGLHYLCINLSTLDRERYAKDRGADHLEVVLRNLDYVKSRPLAKEMKIVVLGTG
ncbi:MAG: radical SAM protein, partial [Thermoanaerobaculia bacterium]